MILKVEERDLLLKELTEEQQNFLTEQLIRSRRTVFANALIKQKGMHIPEDADPDDIEALLSEWIYTGVIDAGQVSPDLRCECGRPLRYQHHVKHKSTGEVKKFGIEHLKEHLGIDSAAVSLIKKGFDAIDYEMDELLLKVKNNWTMDPDLLNQTLPEDILSHMKLNLPLLDRQVNKLKRLRNLKTIQEMIPVHKPEHTKYIGQDLFNEFKEPSSVSNNLPDHLKQVTLQYLENGVRSARILCELLITEHEAPNVRFITGKPQIYVAVCQYIESNKSVVIESVDTVDRHYILLRDGEIKRAGHTIKSD